MAGDDESASDAVLMQAVANGDRAAFRSLLERHIDRVHHFVLRSTNLPGDADDLVQDVFLKVWNNAADFESARASFITWLLRIARNLCIDAHRRHSARPSGHSVSDADAKLENMPTGEASASSELQRARDLAALRAAIGTLPERQRTALTLCHLQGHSNADAAVILDIKVSAVESLLARARRSLKRALSSTQPVRSGEPSV